MKLGFNSRLCCVCGKLRKPSGLPGVESHPVCSKKLQAERAATHSSKKTTTTRFTENSITGFMKRVGA